MNYITHYINKYQNIPPKIAAANNNFMFLYVRLRESCPLSRLFFR